MFFWFIKAHFPPESDFVLFLGLCSFWQFFLYHTIRFQNDQHPSISSNSFAKPSLSQRTQHTDIESKTDKHAIKTQKDPRPKKKKPNHLQRFRNPPKNNNNNNNNMRISTEMQNRESFFPNSLYTKNEFFFFFFFFRDKRKLGDLLHSKFCDKKTLFSSTTMASATRIHGRIARNKHREKLGRLQRERDEVES